MLPPVHTNPVAPAGVEPGTRSRIARQREVIWKFMRHGHQLTLAELEKLSGYPQASISARIRDFRKPEFGGHTIDREYLGGGVYGYRLERGIV